MSKPEFEFGTSGIREVSDFFTDSRVARLGHSIREYLGSDTDKIVIGYDTRKGSKRISEILSDVISDSFNVYLAERPTPTPAVSFYCLDNEDVDFGICSTASHNPIGYNGVKLLDSNGRDADPDITDRISSGIPEETPEYDRNSNTDSVSIVSYYIKELEDRFSDVHLDNMHVFYDGLNGAGSGVVEDVLTSIGAEVRSNRSHPDVGLNGVEPNPTYVDEELITNRMDWADIAFVTDGDADRVRVYTENGSVNSSELLSVIYEFVISNFGEGDVVRTVGAGSMVDSVADKYGHDTHESRIGFKHISKLMDRTGAKLGGDQTDGYCYSSHIPNKDGIFSSIVVCMAHSEESIDQRISRIRNTHDRRFADRRSIECPDELKLKIPNLVSKRADELANKEPTDAVSIDGQKFYFGDSWVLVRPSGTEPKIRLYAESESEERTLRLLQNGEKLVTESIRDLR